MLHITTAFSRLNFLEQIYNFIPKHSDITWHIAKSKYTPALKSKVLKDSRIKVYEVDCLDTDIKAKRDATFDHIKDGYFYLLDDDTIFLETVYDVYKHHNATKFVGMIVGNQKYGENKKIFNRLNTAPLTVFERENTFPIYIIDSGMVVCHNSALNHLRWPKVQIYQYDDCLFWSACYAYFGKEKVLQMNTVVSDYNYFSPKISIRKKIAGFNIKFDIKNPTLALAYRLYIKIIKPFRKNVNSFITNCILSYREAYFCKQLLKIFIRFLKPQKQNLLENNHKKIFCIGRNKTGTSSLKVFFENFDFRVGNQQKAERLFPYLAKGNLEPIIDYCKTAQVFQDCPFSYPYTYQHLDKAFPDSLFILSIRDSPEQWYHSLINFRIKHFGFLPKKQDLKNANYAYKGYLWDTHQYLYNIKETDIFNEEILKNHYLRYNREVIEYFEGRENLIVINVSQKKDFARLCNFLGLTTQKKMDSFPWENKT